MTPSKNRAIRDLEDHVKHIVKLVEQAEEKILKKPKIKDLTNILAQLIRNLNDELKPPKLIR